MSAPSDTASASGISGAWHYDGRNANRWYPVIQPDGAGFRLIGEGWDSGPHHWVDLVALDSGASDRTVYGLKSTPGWRLGFDGAVPGHFAAFAPKSGRYGGVIDRLGLTRAVLGFAVVAAGVIMVVLKAPGWIAPMIPVSWENRLGDVMVGDFGGRLCRTDTGNAAVAALVRKMDPDRRVRAVGVANIPMVNAIALPGGHIILFDGLIQQADGPDEVAGVLGHEIGHVRHRDTLTGLVRQLGLSIVLGGFSGDIGGYTNSLLSLSFSRDAESRADSAAIEGLRAANISPKGTASFFARMGATEPGGKPGTTGAQALTYLSSHPQSLARQKAFLDSAKKGQAYVPSLNATEWRALKTMCKDDPNVEDMDFGL